MVWHQHTRVPAETKLIENRLSLDAAGILRELCGLSLPFSDLRFLLLP
jgi:hypothetical protein